MCAVQPLGGRHERGETRWLFISIVRMSQFPLTHRLEPGCLNRFATPHYFAVH
jgi:hypothetical protein